MRRALVFLFLITCIASRAQVPSLRTTFEKSNIIIGEPFKYTVDALVPSTFKASWFTVPDSIDHFQLISKGQVDSSENGGIVHYSQSFTFTSFDSGSFIFPSFALRFQAIAGNKNYNALTDSARLNITYTPLDSTKTFHDIKTIIEVPDETPLWIWLALADAVLLLIVIILAIIKMIRRSKRVVPVSEADVYHKAIKALQELHKKGLLERGEVKQYHSALVEIFKYYLEGTFNEDIRVMTTSSLIVYLSKMLSRDDLSKIAEVLHRANAVKFAKYHPDNSESNHSLGDIKESIDKIRARSLVKS